MQPTYYYKVHEFMTTFEKGVPDYSNDTEFKESTLLEMRREAIKYYNSQLDAITSKRRFFTKEFKAYSEKFTIGEHAAFSISVQLIEVSSEGESEYYIIGEDPETIQEGRGIEQALFSQIGISISYNEFSNN